MIKNNALVFIIVYRYNDLSHAPGIIWINSMVFFIATGPEKITKANIPGIPRHLTTEDYPPQLQNNQGKQTAPDLRDLKFQIKKSVFNGAR